jgi:hypothetical protein
MRAGPDRAATTSAFGDHSKGPDVRSTARAAWPWAPAIQSVPPDTAPSEPGFPTRNASHFPSADQAGDPGTLPADAGLVTIAWSTAAVLPAVPSST